MYYVHFGCMSIYIYIDTHTHIQGFRIISFGKCLLITLTKLKLMTWFINPVFAWRQLRIKQSKLKMDKYNCKIWFILTTIWPQYLFLIWNSHSIQTGMSTEELRISPERNREMTLRVGGACIPPAAALSDSEEWSQLALTHFLRHFNFWWCSW